MKTRKVKQGECLSKIALEHGLFPETIWDHPDNAELKELRGDPNVLQPGDMVVIPDKVTSEVDCDTESRHTFRKKGVPAELALRFASPSDGTPLASVPYRLVIDGHITHGQTDGKGTLVETLAPNASGGYVSLDIPDSEPLRYDIHLRELDPIESISGAQKRLSNLGYYQGDTNGKLDDPTKLALLEFQQTQELQESGELDQATQDKLLELHGT